MERHQAAGGVEWKWTKGHAGNKYNERADDLANDAAQSVSDLDPLDEEGEHTSPSQGALFGSNDLS